MYRGRWWISNITVLNFHMYIFNFSIHVSCTLVHRQTTFLMLIFEFCSTARLEFVVGKHLLLRLISCLRPESRLRSDGPNEAAIPFESDRLDRLDRLDRWLRLALIFR